MRIHQPGANKFTQLSDVPNSYLGSADEHLVVNALETGIDFVPSSGGSGDVVGPASSTNNAVVRFDLTTGKLIQNGIITETDTGEFENVNGVQFDITPSALTPTEGLLQWNTTDGTLDLGMSGGDITMQLGQEMFQKVRNVSGSTISNGTPVYVNGRTGNRPNIYPARSDAESTSRIIGITTQDITSPSDGYVTTVGYVRQIKTDYSGAGNWGSTWVEGDLLYVSKTIAGQLTNVEPTAPHHSDIVGTVEIVGGLGIGSILVLNEKHYALAELTDVNGTALTTTGQIPVWDNTAGYFDFTSNVNSFQPTLVSGTNIKTINSTSLLGSGDIAISGAVADGDKGDITVTASGATWTIDNGVVTAAKTSITGTPDGSKYLRDDFTWQAVTGGSGLTQPQVMARLSIGF